MKYKDNAHSGGQVQAPAEQRNCFYASICQRSLIVYKALFTPDFSPSGKTQDLRSYI
jgi:hypothetical protein